MGATGNGFGTIKGFDVVDSHEDRLQRLEDLAKETAVSLANVCSKQEVILEKLDSLDSKVEPLHTRLVPLEEAELRRKKVREYVKIITVAACSAFATGLGAWAWKLIEG